MRQAGHKPGDRTGEKTMGNLNQLKTKLMTAEEFAEMDKAAQREIYNFCATNKNYEYCRYNLEVICETIARQYFAEQ